MRKRRFLPLSIHYSSVLRKHILRRHRTRAHYVQAEMREGKNEREGNNNNNNNKIQQRYISRMPLPVESSIPMHGILHNIQYTNTQDITTDLLA